MKLFEMNDNNGITDVRVIRHRFYGDVVQMKYHNKWIEWFFHYSTTYHKYWGWYEPLGIYISNVSV